MSNEYEAGMGTTPGMWEMVSELLDGEKLPASVSEAVKALAQGRATVAIKVTVDAMQQQEDTDAT